MPAFLPTFCGNIVRQKSLQQAFSTTALAGRKWEFTRSGFLIRHHQNSVGVPPALGVGGGYLSRRSRSGRSRIPASPDSKTRDPPEADRSVPATPVAPVTVASLATMARIRKPESGQACQLILDSGFRGKLDTFGEPGQKVGAKQIRNWRPEPTCWPGVCFTRQP